MWKWRQSLIHVDDRWNENDMGGRFAESNDILMRVIVIFKYETQLGA